MGITRHYIDGVTVGREQSPGIEHAFQDAVAAVVKTLLETKSLYQNVRVDVRIFDDFADPDYPAAKLVAEFKKRPLFPYSRGEGNDSADSARIGPGGTDALGTPDDEISIGFFLPNVNLKCRACKRPSSFLSMLSSGQSYFGGPYPIIADETEQVYSLDYRCATCRNSHMSFQVLRRGLRMQLTGRSLPFRPPLSSEWPNEIRGIIGDALVARAEGDIAAGYYHLRTALESYMKSQLGLSISHKIDGSELCDKYNEQLDGRLKSGFPAVAPLYTELSNGMHTRQVDSDRFDRMVDDLLDHLKAKGLFSKYSNS